MRKRENPVNIMNDKLHHVDGYKLPVVPTSSGEVSALATGIHRIRSGRLSCCLRMVLLEFTGCVGCHASRRFGDRIEVSAVESLRGLNRTIVGCSGCCMTSGVGIALVCEIGSGDCMFALLDGRIIFRFDGIMVCTPFLLEVPYDDSCQVLLIRSCGRIRYHWICFIVGDDVTAVIDQKFICSD